MSITILKRSSHGMRSVKLRSRYLYSFGIFLFLFPLIAAYLGYNYALSSKKLMVVQAETISQWQLELHKQKQEIDSAKLTSTQKLNAMTARLAMLQAHVRRLDAAGERILSISGIDAKEFNFKQSPALGGPNSQETKTLNLTTNNATLNNTFTNVELLLESREQQMMVLESLLMDKHMGVERFISGRPTRAGWLSSFYGKRIDPFNGKPAWHGGIDFAGTEGDFVYSTAAGVVTWVGDRSGYGLLIEISHGDGFVTRYGHNKSAQVKTGDVVSKGQAISTMGNSGRSTVAHVHYEILINGKAQDPLKYVNRKAKKS
jgi:murein DD-endopeptidase MepM/ murein hydrolase activator NlpD